MLPTVESLVREFFTDTDGPPESFYNEANLQHELALYLRKRIPTGWRLYIERPASSFRPEATRLVKKEIDLTVADANSDQLVAVELKCPRGGQYPEQIYKACQDLQFLEQLVGAGFAGGVFAIHVDHPLFYGRGSREGIYAHFRSGLPISGVIQKPTGARDRTACITGTYVPAWEVDRFGGRYWVQSIGTVSP